MSIHEFQEALKINELTETFTNAVNGTVSIDTTLSAGDFCGLFCASCITGHMYY